MDEEIKVLIVDDESLVRHALRIFVDTADGLSVVGEATDGLEALDAVNAFQPDVVLMDLQMPRMDGITATAHIVESHPDVSVLAITTFSSEKHIVPALRSGASGYLVKDTHPDQIVEAIRNIAEGKSVIPPYITRQLIESLREPSKDIASDTLRAQEQLTKRESSIVTLLSQGQSNSEMAKELYLSEPTVKANLSRIMRKWSVRDRVQVLIRAVKTNVVQIDANPQSGELNGE